jgi:menaquinone-dependent protoporphyrinogen IX oxidase
MHKMRVLVAYESNAGSTEEVARSVARTIATEDIDVDLKRISELEGVDEYDAAVIGAPMIVGWHRKAVRFIRLHQDRLSRIPVAYLMTALSLTDGGGGDKFGGIRITRDPALLKEPKLPGRLSFKERHSSLAGYLKPVLKRTRKVKPVAVGMFAGKLDYRKLKFLQMAFVMLLFAEKPRDYRDWDQIRGWAAEVRSAFLEGKRSSDEHKG